MVKFPGLEMIVAGRADMLLPPLNGRRRNNRRPRFQDHARFVKPAS